MRDDLVHHAVFGLVGAVRRHGWRRPGFRQGVLQVGHALCRVAIEHVADREREYETVVIAAPERLVEEEVT
jgi:hypothetical protein